MKSKKSKHCLIFCNDGGSLIAPDKTAPIGVDGLIKSAIEPLKNTTVDTFYWQLGTDPYLSTPTSRLSDWYLHDTKIGTKWGDGIDQFRTAGEWRAYENARQLLESGDDPPELLIKHGHNAGLSVFLSIRMNDGHDARLALDDPYLTPIKKEHPEWLLGGDEWYSRYTFNFAVDGVCAYKTALAKEAIEKYDLDGFDLDFNRFPPFFKAGEEKEGAANITGILRELRKALDEKSKRIGRCLELSVRVPAPWEQVLGYGLDLPTWIDEKLIDILIAGVQSWRYRLPVEPFLEASKNSNVQVVAQGLGCYRIPRPRSTRVLFGDYLAEYTPEMCRAVAACYWQAGVDGIFLWNNQFIKHYHNYQYTGQPWRELGDPECLAKLNKHYIADPEKAGGILPVELGDVNVNLDIADDLVQTEKENSLAKATLRVMVENLTVLDKVEFAINGQALDPESAKRLLNYNECWLDFDLSASVVKKGWNEIKIKRIKRNPHVSGDLILHSVEVILVGSLLSAMAGYLVLWLTLDTARVGTQR